MSTHITYILKNNKNITNHLINHRCTAVTMQDQPYALLGSPDSGAKSSSFRSPCFGRTGTLMRNMMLHVYMVCLQCIQGMHTWYVYMNCFLCMLCISMCYMFLTNCHGWSWGLGKAFWWYSDRYFLAEEMMKWSFNKIIIKDILDALSRCQTLLKCWWSDDFGLLGRYLFPSWQITVKDCDWSSTHSHIHAACFLKEKNERRARPTFPMGCRIIIWQKWQHCIAFPRSDVYIIYIDIIHIYIYLLYIYIWL